MAGRRVRLGHKREPNGAVFASIADRTTRARQMQQRQLAERISDARASATHLKPAVVGRLIRGGVGAPEQKFGRGN